MYAVFPCLIVIGADVYEISNLFGNRLSAVKLKGKQRRFGFSESYIFGKECLKETVLNEVFGLIHV